MYGFVYCASCAADNRPAVVVCPLQLHFLRSPVCCRGHVLLNKGIGGTSSGIFAACAEQMVAPDADLVVRPGGEGGMRVVRGEGDEK